MEVINNEKYYVITPQRRSDEKFGYGRMCAMNGEVIAMSQEKDAGDILYEGSHNECQDYFNKWIEERRGY